MAYLFFLLLACGARGSLVQMLGAPSLWSEGLRGQGVRVAVLDTGHAASSEVERINFTNEAGSDDPLGHGTFVASVVGGSRRGCRGLAPASTIVSYRVFTESRASFTTWFLDAFNHAIHSGVHVINLSIGGPDFLDAPFVDKVNELVANGIVLVSATGNDGPLYGTHNNPADMACVIGVGGLNWKEQVAGFSSRGLTTWELPGGGGRVKPDVVTYGTSVLGSHKDGGCRALSGTSVACPVVTGSVALLVQFARTNGIAANPASIKQAVLASAVRLEGNENLFEQGAGRLNLWGARDFLASYTPHASAFPSYIDTTECPYFWPYCTQPLFYDSMPMAFNFTILNGMGVTGSFSSVPAWHSSSGVLEVMLNHSEYLWPWSGHLSAEVRVVDPTFVGVVEGVIRATVISPGGHSSPLAIPLRVRVDARPPRSRRLLWDQYHSLRYPGGYFPRDDLMYTRNPFDWNADHLYSNFRSLFRVLRSLGYFVEVQGEPWTCFNASSYGALLLVDPEEEYFPQEITKLSDDVRQRGLGLFVAADWFNTTLMKKVNFFDQNTHKYWTPVTGGANVPALNTLLASLGIQFSDRVLTGSMSLSGRTFDYSSGTSLTAFPKGAHVVRAPLQDEALIMLENIKAEVEAPVFGWFQEGSARVAVTGDSSFLDDAGRPPIKTRGRKSSERGFHVLEDIVSFLTGALGAAQVHPGSAKVLDEAMQAPAQEDRPKRLFPAAMLRHSKVMSRELPRCRAFVAAPRVSTDALVDWKRVKERVEAPILPVYESLDAERPLLRVPRVPMGYLLVVLATFAVAAGLFVSRHRIAQRQRLEYSFT